MKKLFSITTLLLISYLTYAQSNLIKNVTITVDTTLLKTKSVKTGLHANLYQVDGYKAKFNEFTPNTWHYVAITKDNNLNSNIYIDGVLSNTEIYGNRAFNWYEIYLGASFYTSFSNFFKGSLDDFRISNKVRTSSEILANYNSNLPLTKDANTIALWKFDETSGKNFSNQVQGLTNGTLNGNAQFQQGKFGNAVYFDGVNSYGDCNFDMPESNITFEFWVKLQDTTKVNTVIQPYGMYSGDICFATDTILTNSSKNITWSTGDTGYSITVDPKTTPIVWVSNGVNKDTINFNRTCLKSISVTDTLVIGRITGLNSLPDNFGTIKVYPNPSNDVLNISVSNPNANYSIQITNQLGQVLYTNTLSNGSLQVNVNSIGANGLYFIKILDLSNNVLDTRKLVLE